MSDRIGIVTGGGDCPGLNAVIRAVAKAAAKRGWETIGFLGGYEGILEPQQYMELDYQELGPLLTRGGTILGTANRGRFSAKVGHGETRRLPRELIDGVKAGMEKQRIRGLVSIGGDGSLSIAQQLFEGGVPIVGVPKTIDNDLYGTDVTFGFDTAVTTAAEAIDKVHTTASSHHRVMIVEVMGRYAGWIALHAGVAGGADVILIPEIPYDLSKVCDYVLGRSSRGKRFSIIVAAEGAKAKDGSMVISHRVKGSPDPIRLGGIANKLALEIGAKTALDCRAVVLGHIQRGGTPTPYDRTLATNFGHTAMELLMKGVKNHLVVLKDGCLSSISLRQVAGKTKTVPRNCDLVRAALSVGTSFGE